MRNQRGITLVELMTVMVIVGILTAIAVPTYTSYTLKTKRSDGRIALTSLAQQLERCYSRFNVYNATSATQCNLPTFPYYAPSNASSLTGTYAIALDTGAVATAFCAGGGLQAQCFTIMTVPINGQTRDTHCGTLTLNSGGQKGGNNTDCW